MSRLSFAPLPSPQISSHDSSMRPHPTDSSIPSSIPNHTPQPQPPRGLQGQAHGGAAGEAGPAPGQRAEGRRHGQGPDARQDPAGAQGMVQTAMDEGGVLLAFDLWDGPLQLVYIPVLPLKHTGAHVFLCLFRATPNTKPAGSRGEAEACGGAGAPGPAQAGGRPNAPPVQQDR